MLYILRAGIKVPIPPSVAVEGGEAVEAYVASRPAARFPNIPTALTEGADIEAYLAELSAAGVLAPLQVAEDAAYREEEQAREAARLVAKPPAGAASPDRGAARALAAAEIARLSGHAAPLPLPTPWVAPDSED